MIRCRSHYLAMRRLARLVPIWLNVVTMSFAEVSAKYAQKFGVGK